MFEYIMARIPLLVTDLPEMDKIIRSYEIGAAVDQLDDDTILDAMKKIEKWPKTVLMKNLDKAANDLNWQNEEKVLIKLLKKLLNSNKPVLVITWKFKPAPDVLWIRQTLVSVLIIMVNVAIVRNMILSLHQIGLIIIQVMKVLRDWIKQSRIVKVQVNMIVFWASVAALTHPILRSKLKN